MVGPLRELSFADACARFDRQDAGSFLAQSAYSQVMVILGGNDDLPLPIARWAVEAGPQVRADARMVLTEWEFAEALPGSLMPVTEQMADAHRSSCRLARAWIGED